MPCRSNPDTWKANVSLVLGVDGHSNRRASKSEGHTSRSLDFKSAHRGGVPGLNVTFNSKKHQEQSVEKSAPMILTPKSRNTRKRSAPKPVASGQDIRTSRTLTGSSPSTRLQAEAGGSGFGRGRLVEEGTGTCTGPGCAPNLGKAPADKRQRPTTTKTTYLRDTVSSSSILEKRSYISAKLITVSRRYNGV